MKAILVANPKSNDIFPVLSPHSFQSRTQWHHATPSPLAQNLQSLVPLAEHGFEVPGQGAAVVARKQDRSDGDEWTIFQRGGQDGVLLRELERSEEGRRERASGGGEDARGEGRVSETPAGGGWRSRLTRRSRKRCRARRRCRCSNRPVQRARLP